METEAVQKERKKLTVEQAEALLPDGDVLHTFRQPRDGILVGADWEKSRIIERFKTNGVELAGFTARSMNHGLASFDEALGWLYVETRKNPKK